MIYLSLIVNRLKFDRKYNSALCVRFSCSYLIVWTFNSVLNNFHPFRNLAGSRFGPVGARTHLVLRFPLRFPAEEETTEHSTASHEASAGIGPQQSGTRGSEVGTLI